MTGFFGPTELLAFIILQQAVIMSSIIPQGFAKGLQILIGDSIVKMKPENAAKYANVARIMSPFLALVTTLVIVLSMDSILGLYLNDEFEL